MELVEKKFRDTPINNKKYGKRLTDFIDYLVSKGRILEAKYFFEILLNVKPNNARTIRLGYSLSILSFDDAGVRKFDKLLLDSKPKDIEIFWFQLRYYLSRNDIKNCENCCEFLLSKKIKSEYLTTVIEACLNLESYVLVRQLVRYLDRKKLKLANQGNNQLKKIAAQRLVDNLLKVKCG